MNVSEIEIENEVEETEKKKRPDDSYFGWDEGSLNWLDQPVERGGPGSGHRGHEGRPGEVGGSLPSGEAKYEPPEYSDEVLFGEMYEGRPKITLPKNALGAKVRFMGVSPDIAEGEGLIVPTQDQVEYVANLIFNTMPDDVKKLWKAGTSDTVIIAIHPNEFYGMHQGNWIILGQYAINPESGSETAEHEFIHHILQQDYLWMKVNDVYHTKDMFRHADRRKTPSVQNNEDMTMMLTSFDPDREKWIDNLMDIPPIMRDSRIHDETGNPSGLLDRTRASAKIDEIVRFMTSLNLWPKDLVN